MDVRDFFASITERQVYRVFRRLGYGALLSFQMARLCTRAGIGSAQRRPADDGLPHKVERRGRLPQGAPTSPGLANLTAKDLDRQLVRIAAEYGWVYTRYADDLAFSTYGPSSRAQAGALAFRVTGALEAHGLSANHAKTVIAPPGARRIVLGLLVDGPEPRLTRAFRDNLETHLFALTKHGAAAHQRARKFASTIGMRRHVTGLVAFAHHIEPAYAKGCYARLDAVDWSS